MKISLHHGSAKYCSKQDSLMHSKFLSGDVSIGSGHDKRNSEGSKWIFNPSQPSPLPLPKPTPSTTGSCHNYTSTHGFQRTCGLQSCKWRSELFANFLCGCPNKKIVILVLLSWAIWKVCNLAKRYSTTDTFLIILICLCLSERRNLWNGTTMKDSLEADSIITCERIIAENNQQLCHYAPGVKKVADLRAHPLLLSTSPRVSLPPHVTLPFPLFYWHQHQSMLMQAIVLKLLGRGKACDLNSSQNQRAKLSIRKKILQKQQIMHSWSFAAKIFLAREIMQRRDASGGKWLRLHWIECGLPSKQPNE